MTWLQIETFIATAQEVSSDVTLSGVTVLNRQLFTAVTSSRLTTHFGEKRGKN